MLKKIFALINRAGNSRFGQIDLRDVIHGIFLAVESAVATQLIQTLGAGKPIDLHTLKYSALAALVTSGSYYLKELLSNEDGTFGKLPDRQKQ